MNRLSRVGAKPTSEGRSIKISVFLFWVLTFFIKYAMLMLTCIDKLIS